MDLNLIVKHTMDSSPSSSVSLREGEKAGFCWRNRPHSGAIVCSSVARLLREFGMLELILVSDSLGFILEAPWQVWRMLWNRRRQAWHNYSILE